MDNMTAFLSEKKCISVYVEKRVYKAMYLARIVIISGITTLQKLHITLVYGYLLQ